MPSCGSSTSSGGPEASSSPSDFESVLAARRRNLRKSTTSNRPEEKKEEDQAEEARDSSSGAAHLQQVKTCPGSSSSSSSDSEDNRQQQYQQHCAEEATGNFSPPWTPPRASCLLHSSSGRRRRQRTGSNNKHVSISPQHSPHQGTATESPTNGSANTNNTDDDDDAFDETKTVTGTTVTAATTALTSSTSGHHHHHHSTAAGNTTPAMHRYTALSDMVRCAYSTPDHDDDNVDASSPEGRDESQQPDDVSSLPIPVTFPRPADPAPTAATTSSAMTSAAATTRRIRRRGDTDPVADSLDGGRRSENYNVRYYRIAYRGVVALLAAPESGAPRSGSYLSYGEIFASCCDNGGGGEETATTGDAGSANLKVLLGSEAEETGGSSDDALLHQSMERQLSITNGPRIPPFSKKNKAHHPLPDHVVRIDHVLTGGYAMDTHEETAAKSSSKTPMSRAKTPKRSNANYYYVPMPDDIASDRNDGGHRPAPATPTALGYLFTQRQEVRVVEPLASVPRSEVGHFLYRVISNSPLPILTGPALDAPKTKAMLLPGTMHEVSLRICIDTDDADPVWFLRLSHRRGWIADRKVLKRKAADPAQQSSIPVVQEVSVESNDTDEASIVSSIVSSIAVSSVSAPSSAARRRHRPPRRRRDQDDQSLPRHIGGTKLISTTTPVKLSRNGLASHDSSPAEKILSPSSNMSLLSEDEESLEPKGQLNNAPSKHQRHPSSPELSYATSAARSGISSAAATASAPAIPDKSTFYLMRVTAPGGLKILDAPQFQVNRLIHGSQPTNVSSSHLVSELESDVSPPKTHHSIFQTMSGRLTTTGPSQHGNPAIFDSTSKTRILPRGVLFEASRRMEVVNGATGGVGAYSRQGGLIKLSDNSGWAIVPSQEELDQQYRSYHGGAASVKEGEATRAFEEVGNAIIGGDGTNRTDGTWLRVVSRSGVSVSCPPPSPPMVNDNDTSKNDASPTSKGSAIGSNQGSNYGPLPSHDSDVASSVGSGFLDAMFRTPKKKRGAHPGKDAWPARAKTETRQPSTMLPCGTVVRVEQWLDSFDGEHQQQSTEFARLLGGQGWVPLSLSDKTVAVQVAKPEFRLGSFWFRVQSSRGIKVRTGPSRKAPSIKSEDGVYFRFECGEFLRASEIITVFSVTGEPRECYAKLYRNRHVRLRESNESFRPLYDLTMEAEWVQVHSDKELFLEECALEPRIERHKQGWRYSVVSEKGVVVRRGPSFASERTDMTIFGGESVVVNERVAPAGEKINWLRLKDGKGWVHDVSDDGRQVMIPHSLRHQSGVMDRPQKAPAPKEEIAYNTIVARLFRDPPAGNHR